MIQITDIDKYRVDRSRYIFKEKKVALANEEGIIVTYGCIVLVAKENDAIVAYTGLERYVIDLSKNVFSESRFRIATSRVIGFLNYVLYETKVNNLCEIDINVIREYLLKKKNKDNGEEIKSDSWGRIRYDIFVFLQNYYKCNKDKVEFSYNIDEILETKIIKEKRQKGIRRHVVNEYKMLNIKAPKKRDNKRRNRVIMYGHLKTFLYVAKKYEPMIYLAVLLMAYAGLREGEVVNLAFDDIEIIRKLGVVEKIVINLDESDKFRVGKSHKGVIKKIRQQEVYTNDDFLEEALRAIEFHKDYLESLGLPNDGSNALFYNKHKKPMSVTTFIGRIRDLFYDHFIRVLKETSENTLYEGETYAHIEKYEEEYPGAHMFRHWFTMFLVTKEHLRPEEVRKWRGDEPDSNSYEEYIHLNHDLIEEYKKTAYSFQEGLLEDIYE